MIATFSSRTREIDGEARTQYLSSGQGYILCSNNNATLSIASDAVRGLAKERGEDNGTSHRVFQRTRHNAKSIACSQIEPNRILDKRLFKYLYERVKASTCLEEDRWNTSWNDASSTRSTKVPRAPWSKMETEFTSPRCAGSRTR